MMIKPRRGRYILPEKEMKKQIQSKLKEIKKKKKNIQSKWQDTFCKNKIKTFPTKPDSSLHGDTILHRF